MNISDVIKSEPNNAILRKLDELGRVVIPKDFRDRLLKEDSILYMEVVREYIVLKVEDKTKTGIVRELDELGRLTIFKEIRDSLGINTGDQIFVWTYKNYIVLRKKEDSCVFCQGTKKLVKHKDKLVCENCLKALNKIGNIFVK